MKKKNFIFYFFLISYFTLLFYLCTKINLWVDEIFTLDTTSRNTIDVIRQSYYFEGQPPLYFLLLSIWRMIFHGLFFARLFSLLCITASSLFLYKIVRLIANKNCSQWLVVIFLLNPFSVWAALEIRVYALLILLSTISIYFFFQYSIVPKKKYLYLFLFISLLGVYAQYFFVLQIIALAFSYLIFKGWKPFLKLCIYLIPVALFSLPNLYFIPQELDVIRPENVNYTNLDLGLQVFLTLQEYFLAIGLLPFGTWSRWLIKIPFVIIGLLGYYKLMKRQLSGKEYNSLKINAILVNIILVALITLVALFCTLVILSQIFYTDKYMAVAYPLVILLYSIFSIYKPPIKTIIFTAISIYFSLLIYNHYSTPIKIYDYKSIAEYVTKIEHKNEPILFYNNSRSLVFEYYYKGTNPIYPLPHKVKFDSTFMESLKDTFQLNQSIENIKTQSNSYLFISDLKELPYVKELSRKDVDSFLVHNYKTTLDTFLFGKSKNNAIRIRRLKKISKFE